MKPNVDSLKAHLNNLKSLRSDVHTILTAAYDPEELDSQLNFYGTFAEMELKNAIEHLTDAIKEMEA